LGVFYWGFGFLLLVSVLSFNGTTHFVVVFGRYRNQLVKKKLHEKSPPASRIYEGFQSGNGRWKSVEGVKLLEMMKKFIHQGGCGKRRTGSGESKKRGKSEARSVWQHRRHSRRSWSMRSREAGKKIQWRRL